MAEFLTEEQIDEYKIAFFPFTKNGEGMIQLKHLSAVLISLGQTPSELEIQDMLDYLKTNIDGTIDFPGFLSLMVHCLNFDGTIVDDKFIKTCQQFDKAGVGTISKEELRHVIIKVDKNITDQEVNELLNDAKFDCNGNIDYESFLMELMKK